MGGRLGRPLDRPPVEAEEVHGWSEPRMHSLRVVAGLRAQRRSTPQGSNTSGRPGIGGRPGLSGRPGTSGRPDTEAI